jgi:hypothetical protein
MQESREFSWELKVRPWREVFLCDVVQRYVECVIQWDWYDYCVEIRFQDTANEDCES